MQCLYQWSRWPFSLNCIKSIGKLDKIDVATVEFEDFSEGMQVK